MQNKRLCQVISRLTCPMKRAFAHCLYLLVAASQCAAASAADEAKAVEFFENKL
jgi:hypothetical protein